MQIVDLRQLHSRSLEGLFQEEAQRWREELFWDYRPSIDLVRKFVDSHSLGGYAAIEGGNPIGYGFYVLEDHKGLIGGLFVSSSEIPQNGATERLLSELVGTLRATPRLQRIEAQLMFPLARNSIQHSYRSTSTCIPVNSCFWGWRKRVC